MPPCPVARCCNCIICAVVIDYTTQARLASGTVMITYRDAAGAAVATDSGAYAAGVGVCFLAPSSPAWQSYVLSGTSPDSPYALAVTDSITVPPCPAAPLPGCSCDSVPTTLNMHVNNPALNYGIFQDSELVYGPTPPEYVPLSIGPAAFFSPGPFADQITGDSFRYFFTCYTGLYALGRLYETSVFGSPYRDIFRYSWLVGIGGNTCAPFQLESGTIFPGADPACHVSVNTRGTF